MLIEEEMPFLQRALDELAKKKRDLARILVKKGERMPEEASVSAEGGQRESVAAAGDQHASVTTEGAQQTSVTVASGRHARSTNCAHKFQPPAHVSATG